jgi:ethanolamine ammonia-lyase large subunit
VFCPDHGAHSPGRARHSSANAHHNVDQQTCEARACAAARAFEPLLVNSVVGFIGPKYFYDGRKIICAGLEDHWGKLLGPSLGADVCNSRVRTGLAGADFRLAGNALLLPGFVHHG